LIEKSMDRDNFMEAEEALKFGLVDKIVDEQPDTE
jgi:ATP-dependent Clp protease protease subunit